MYFNPRSPWGERHLALLLRLRFLQFQSTLSVRRATFDLLRQSNPQEWISIHALREESDINEYGFPVLSKISIHALREESDNVKYYDTMPSFGISIHALREESDFF